MNSLRRDVVVRGVGLHTGEPAQVTLAARPGPVTLGAGGFSAGMPDLVVVASDRSTTVSGHGGRLRVATVEHLLAALAGLGLHQGLSIEVDGPEVPLLDGGAAAWCDAIAALGLEAPTGQAPPLHVAREAEISVGASRYRFSPGPSVDVAVCIEFDDPRISRDARWTGSPLDFRARIAPARTFARECDVEELARAGLARHVDPSSVVVLGTDAIHHAGPAFSSDEPARHKLLDLIGDLYLYGGPPRGGVFVVRPGHSPSAVALCRALADGVVVRT